MHAVFLLTFGLATALSSFLVLNRIFPINQQSDTMGPPVVVPISQVDPSSYSNVDVFVLKHLSLQWKVDFEAKAISGTAALTIEPSPDRSADADTTTLILDTRDVNVISVRLEGSTAALPFALAVPHKAFGAALKIDLPASVQNAPFVVLIEYSTTAACSALQWLEPQQTAGKTKPFLFSQCQAIHARSLVPCQDTPAVKFTYEARVTAPEGLVVLMSAIKNKVRPRFR